MFFTPTFRMIFARWNSMVRGLTDKIAAASLLIAALDDLGEHRAFTWRKGCTARKRFRQDVQRTVQYLDLFLGLPELGRFEKFPLAVTLWRS